MSSLVSWISMSACIDPWSVMADGGSSSDYQHSMMDDSTEVCRVNVRSIRLTMSQADSVLPENISGSSTDSSYSFVSAHTVSEELARMSR